MTLRLRCEMLHAALRSAPYWHAGQLATFFAGAKSPERAAEAWASREEKAGWIHSAMVDACLPAAPQAPLDTLRPGGRVIDFDRREYLLEKRWDIAPQRIRIYWASKLFAERFGSWAGTDSFSCPHKVGHDLLCSWVWLRYLAISETVALKRWIPERQLMQESRARGSREPVPDALITLGAAVTAIEICGRYSATLLRNRWERIVRHFSRRFGRWSWVLW